jgi:alpha-1,3-rhamnosyl/mannosyltransferase
MALPDLLRRLGADVYHTPIFVLPAVRACRYLCTIHDVIPRARPDLAPAEFTRFFNEHVGRALKAASHIVTVSEYSKRDCIRHLSLDPGFVTAIHEPVSPLFHPRSAEECADALRGLGLRPGFILSVGAIDRRKNLGRLVEAYGLLRKGKADVPPLVIVGAPSGDGFDLDTEVATRGLRKEVRILGRVPDEAMTRLYSSAGVFVFPSLYEGFGLPVVEAMASGTPVVASKASSLPEVAGDAAVLVDPENAEEIRSAMERVLADADLRADLARRGLGRAAGFSLERQGERLLELYRRLIREAA